nr:SUMF1/EgtB/PvdO family nonheme iron enzyme [uncultured Albidiferax sp.]
MPPVSTPLASIDSPAMRQAGRDLLSLALMDARNHTLHLLDQFESAPPIAQGGLQPRWLAGHIGWMAEAWLGRNTQRSRGTACAFQPTRLASIEPHADQWWNAEQMQRRVALAGPDLATTKQFLLNTLESTLELLEKTPETDEALYFYRLALFHEDLRGEQLITLAQIHGIPLHLPLPGSMQLRPPLSLPACEWQLGSERGGFVFDNEKWAHPVAVPDFEVDAQPVSWAQFVEFVDDGGYDNADWWHPAGWVWLQTLAEGEGRRGPRYVDQIGVASGAVLQTRFGARTRLAGQQPAMHMAWWEADAWCRWAGRRLPSEQEWERAALGAAGQGFRWGDVHEWTASSLVPWPGFSADPWMAYSVPWFGRARVLRGASFATRARMKHPKFRGFALPGDDVRFVGFRSCAI